MTNLINAMIFSPVQLVVIIVLALLLIGFVALDVVFGVTLRLKAERKLYDENLQARREALLNKLEYIRAGGTAETHTWLDFVQYEENEDEEEDEDTDGEQAPIRMIPQPQDFAEVAEGVAPLNTEILCVDDLSPRLRRKLAMRAKRYDGKMFYVRYSLGFEARLRYADDETKVRYMELMDYVKAYEGVSIAKGFASRRICIDKTTIAMVLFSGKKMCMSLALNPSDYKYTKFSGEDKSNTKRFAKTPMFVRIYDDGKLDKIKYLFDELAKKHNLRQGEIKQGVYDLSERTREDMILSGSVRVIIVEDVPFAVAQRIRAEKQNSANIQIAQDDDNYIDDLSEVEFKDDETAEENLPQTDCDEMTENEETILDDKISVAVDEAAATTTEE